MAYAMHVSPPTSQPDENCGPSPAAEKEPLCKRFKSDSQKLDLCINCNNSISKHSVETIPDNKCLEQVLEYVVKEKCPDLTPPALAPAVKLLLIRNPRRNGGWHYLKDTSQISKSKPVAIPSSKLQLSCKLRLTGEVRCHLFNPDKRYHDFCLNCSNLINKHSVRAIPDNKCLEKALEYITREKTPSQILPCSLGVGALFHGNYKAVLNPEFLREERVTHIVNTATNLETYRPQFKLAKESAQIENGISFLDLRWEDNLSFAIPEADLVRCVRYIHEARIRGGSVLVHCAQGRSRSTTAVVAYLMACHKGTGVDFMEGLSLVKECRSVAKPNDTFVKLLRAFGKSSALKELRASLNEPGK